MRDKNRSILMKFGILQQILNPMTVTWLRIEIFKIQDGSGRHIENRFFWPYVINRFSDFSEILYEEACRQRLRDKNWKFLKSKMADGRHRKSPYLGEKSSDFDKIWYTVADIEPDDSHVTKNWNL